VQAIQGWRTKKGACRWQSGHFIEKASPLFRLQACLSGGQSSLQSCRRLCWPNIRLCKSYRPFFRPTFVSAKVTSPFTGEHLPLQSCRRLCCPNIRPCKCYRRFFRPTFASAKVTGPFTGEHLPCKSCRRLCSLNIGPCKSYRRFYRPTLSPVNGPTAWSARFFDKFLPQPDCTGDCREYFFITDKVHNTGQPRDETMFRAN
jgi:hypothetical protein